MGKLNGLQKIEKLTEMGAGYTSLIALSNDFILSQILFQWGMLLAKTMFAAYLVGLFETQMYKSRAG